MTETKVFKLHENKQVEAITTMLKIEGIKHKVFEYEEYAAIEVTGTPLEIIRASTIYQQVTTLKL
ncbi:2-C-methyl-D-erythritol 4-phosphate cytidylyltransferase [Bacteroides caccae]|uniref:2-C-methyl-D-erythritol 4-phosphate cytidylyltransferase n=1 Tax=Bacteroides caccae TaxID=47678 RepID=A0A6A1JSF4_9BACE|nr:2-C-methyl-D-erythritol 4-phosphate cytidylyltransferase [Bacteroides caccae]KAA5476885.1 2-C-methyl-D-erythritol 4-phosphate cytidylyltransferase [Bacteroides caccae]KAA5484717.1 2-C-methyl-D-erythritol 4-phosphate cytidylyltransferase [Bacteroides caccae]KAA5488221.1 2-C-methyl-D-erythritol 4-phosphate cytidylyltransferase [Bacteroides caccae]KAA5499581.1 2-C-methyl-D-erythritol 4-phosphate cytidylyltransferase [Bacteroides caccae]